MNMERELNPMILDCIGSVPVNSGFSVYREVYKNKFNVCVCVCVLVIWLCPLKGHACLMPQEQAHQVPSF